VLVFNFQSVYSGVTSASGGRNIKTENTPRSCQAAKMSTHKYVVLTLVLYGQQQTV